MAAFNDGIQNLQEFCSQAAQANAQLQADAANLDSFERHLQELENAAHEQGDGLSEQLRQLDSMVDETGQQATDGITALSTAAHDIADARLVAGGEDVTATETTLTEGLAHGREDLQGGFDDLAHQGFEATQSTLDAALADLDADRRETDQAFDGADTAVEEKDPELDGARTEADQDFAEAGQALDTEGSALDQASQEGQSAWTESIAGELESGCQGVSEPLEAVYQAFGDTARSDGDALIEAVSHRAESAAQLLGVETANSMESAFTETVTGDLEPWGAAVETTLGVLREAEPIARELDPLVEELVTAERVVVTVERLIEVMGGGA